MQSIYVFSCVSHAEAVSTVGQLATVHLAGKQWFVAPLGEREATVEITNDFFDELEPEERAHLSSRLGGSPLTFVVDVSRRSSRQVSVVAFIRNLMTRLGGVACDDNSDHFWSLEEVTLGVAGELRFAEGYFSR